MNAYECFWCGVTYREVEDLRACTVCGQPLHGRWFYAVATERQGEPEPRRDHLRKPGLRKPASQFPSQAA